MPRIKPPFELLKNQILALGVSDSLVYSLIASRCLYHALSNTDEVKKLTFNRQEEGKCVDIYLKIDEFPGDDVLLEDIQCSFKPDQAFKMLMSFYIEDIDVKNLYDFCYYDDYAGEFEQRKGSHSLPTNGFMKLDLLLLQSFSNHQRVPEVELTDDEHAYLNKLKTIEFEPETTLIMESIDVYLSSLR
ncbi:MAG: hypothetical protein ACI9TY_000856 [Alphaproteobacteria bacterium]|jgi:hypothetical protein